MSRTRRALTIAATCALAALASAAWGDAAPPAAKPAAAKATAAKAAAAKAAAAKPAAKPGAPTAVSPPPANARADDAGPLDPPRAIAIAEDRRRGPDIERPGYLAHADAAVRRRAVRALGRIQDSTAVSALAPLLEDPDAAVRRETAFALGQIGHRSARVPLERALERGDRDLAPIAIEALGKLGDKAATPRVLAALRDPAPALRGEAAVALWRLADSTAVDALIAASNDPDAGVRWRAIYALEKIVMPDRVVLRVALQLEHPDPRVRAYAVRTLGRQKSMRGTAYVVPRVADPDPGVAVNAIRALQLIADSICAPCGASVLEALSHPNPWLRVTAATALGDRWIWVPRDSSGRRRFVEALEKALADPDIATRGAAARSLLAQIGEAELPVVRPLLEDSSVYVRAAVIQGLRLLPASADAAVRELLLPRLEPPHPLLERMTAAEALGGRRDAAARSSLRAGLADTSVLYVAAVAGALAEAGDSASVPVLARAYATRAADADPDARISIRDALRGLAGRAFADSVERRHPARNAEPASYPPDFPDPPSARGAILHTSRGDIEWAFEPLEAPQTVRNFVRLAERGYFDGDVFHRVVPNFVIQDGDPTGTGSGGPGYSIRCEYNTLRYEPGMVGMALSGKDTGGSQWFITHAPQPHLDGRYTIFARVVSGMPVVNTIVQGDRIDRIEILP